MQNYLSFHLRETYKTMEHNFVILFKTYDIFLIVLPKADFRHEMIHQNKTTLAAYFILSYVMLLMAMW